MARKIFFIGLTAIIISIPYLRQQSAASADANAATSEQEYHDRMLNATLLITMYGYQPAEVQSAGIATSASKRVVANGLGTLVVSNGQQWVITHDHWSLENEDLELVQIHNVAQDLVAQLNGSQFLDMLRYRDGGTMILSAPASLSQHVAAVEWRPAQPVEVGAAVEILRRSSTAPGGLEIVKAVVVILEINQEQAVIQMRTLNGSVIVPGDSGGGIWQHGRLIGNMWLSLVVDIEATQTVDAETRTEENWSQAALLLDSMRDQLDEQVAPPSGVLDSNQAPAEGSSLPPAAQEDGIG